MAEVIGMDGTFREKYEEFDNDNSHLETVQRPIVPVTSDREKPRIGTEWTYDNTDASVWGRNCAGTEQSPIVLPSFSSAETRREDLMRGMIA